MNPEGIDETLSNFESHLKDLHDLRKAVLSSKEVPHKARLLIYESIIVKAFRLLENTLEDIFYNFLLERRTISGNTLNLAFAVRDRNHAVSAIVGGDRWADWTDPKLVRRRADDFISLENPLSLSIQTHLNTFNWMKSIRNHAAHNSTESFIKYKKTLESMLVTIPSDIPSIGDFLFSRPTKGPARNREVLAFFLGALEECVKNAMGVPVNNA